MGRSIAGLWERIAAVAAAAALAGWGITALYRTADRRHTSYGGIHVAAAINWYNARQPEAWPTGRWRTSPLCMRRWAAGRGWVSPMNDFWKVLPLFR